MSDLISDEHLRSEALEIIAAHDGNFPEELPPETTQVAIEKSDVDPDELSRREREQLFWETETRMKELLEIETHG